MTPWTGVGDDQEAYLLEPLPRAPEGLRRGCTRRREAAFEARLGKPFSIDQPHDGYLAVGEHSPYGIELDIDYPNSSIEQLIDAAQDASVPWGKASPEVRAGVLIEVLDRLAAQSFEMAMPSWPRPAKRF